MIVFEKLRYKNLLSTGHYFTEIVLNKSPTTLIIGVNGSGKSTMLDALTIGLFGKPFRDINKPDIVNSINNADCVVEVEFSEASKKYKVVRGMKPTIFEIYCDGKLLDQTNAKDYQDYLETHILKFNYKSFTQIVILGTSSFIPFMQLDPADRREIIEELLDIKIFSTMNKVLKTKLSNIKNEISTIKASLESTMTKIEMQKKYIEEAKKSNSDQIENKRKEYDQNIEYVNARMKDIEPLQETVNTLLKRTSDEKTLSTAISELGILEAKIDTNKSKLERDKNFYLENDNCPSCKQDISQDFKQTVLNTANTKLAEFTSALDKLLLEQNKIKKRLNEISALHKEIKERQAEIIKLNMAISHTQSRANKILSEIEELQNKKVLSDDMITISRTLVQELEDFQKQRDSILDNKRYLEIAETLLKDGGIKAKIIKQYLPVINKMVNKYLQDMDFFVNFNIDEEFKETIKSRFRDTFGYGNFSEGEKMRIDLALLFTWRAVAKMKNSINTNLLILDEVFDSSLDNAGTEEFLKLLNALGKENNVFVISHKGDILIDKFSNVIKFSKTQNFSRMV